ncbi:hypothetical protein AB0L74_33775 [Streptomyces sp. NPDC052020]|uniref:hypothetical protein n=1 Tax=Streptomyces sp. NPDC052020 TaxID=3155677 RepID=UPI00343804B2
METGAECAPVTSSPPITMLSIRPGSDLRHQPSFAVIDALTRALDSGLLCLVTMHMSVARRDGFDQERRQNSKETAMASISPIDLPQAVFRDD